MLGTTKPNPPGFRGQTADHEVHLVGDAEAVPANLQQLAGGNQRFQLSFERRALLARECAESVRALGRWRGDERVRG